MLEGMVRRTALVLAHDEVPGRGTRELGTVGPALTALGYRVVVTALLPGGPSVPAPESAAMVLVLGSAESVADDTVPWLAAEPALLRRVVDARVPVLGICFGAQALSRVLGGTVARAVRPERGFVALDSTAPDLLPAGEWMQFHDDSFTLPPGAAAPARNDVGLQGFVHGPHLGVQFHPEISPDLFAAWREDWRVTGSYPEVAAQTDLDALSAEITRRAPASEKACHEPVARFAAHAADGAPRSTWDD